MNPLLRLSRRQEKQVADKLKGRVQPGSGNRPNPYLKEDVVNKEFLVQCKGTTKKSYSLKYAEFRKTWEHAVRQLKMPLWIVEFWETDQLTENLAILRFEDLQQLLLDLHNAQDTAP